MTSKRRRHEIYSVQVDRESLGFGPKAETTAPDSRPAALLQALADESLPRDAQGFIPAAKLYPRFHNLGAFPDYDEMVTTLYEMEIAGDVYLYLLADGALAVKPVGLDEWGKLCLARVWRKEAVHLDFQKPRFWSTAGVDTLLPLLAAGLMEPNEMGDLYRFTPLGIHYMGRPRK